MNDTEFSLDDILAEFQAESKNISARYGGETPAQTEPEEVIKTAEVKPGKKREPSPDSTRIFTDTQDLLATLNSGLDIPDEEVPEVSDESAEEPAVEEEPEAAPAAHVRQAEAEEDEEDYDDDEDDEDEESRKPRKKLFHFGKKASDSDEDEDDEDDSDDDEDDDEDEDDEDDEDEKPRKKHFLFGKKASDSDDDEYDEDDSDDEYDEDDYDDEDEDEDDEDRPHKFHRFLWSPIFMVLFIACLAWGTLNLNPASGSASQKAAREAAAAATPVVEETPAVTAEPVAAETAAETTAEPVVTPEPVVEKTHYTIPSDALSAPAPDQSKFVTLSIDEADKVMDVIQQARDDGLLDEDETVVFSPDVEFYYDSTIQYYYDETILSICWKEVIDGNTCSFNETKVADASQFRRKFADDTFGGGNTYYASELSKSVNAVASMNADYYLFRDFGIVVYDGTLYRFNTATYTGNYKKYNCVDTLFVDANGDFHFKKLLEESTWDDMEQYIADNNIQFSIAFGPVLVENYEAQYCDWYPVGEVDKGYSRAGIGQVDTLHYLYMSLNHSPEAEARWNINTFAEHFAEKGVMCAYALDGGQTSEVLMNGEPYNYIDYGTERLVSDIIYFGTALPEEEG